MGYGSKGNACRDQALSDRGNSDCRRVLCARSIRADAVRVDEQPVARFTVYQLVHRRPHHPAYIADTPTASNWPPADPTSVATTSVVTQFDNSGVNRRIYRLRVNWPDPTIPLMVTPLAGLEYMSGINEAYSRSAACPWGFEHRGVDFFATNLFKEFRACESGVVENIDKFLNLGNSHWQVNVRIQYDDRYAFGYAFEPMSSSSTHGDTQLASLIITTGQHLARGESLGYLYAPSNGAHVHYDFYTNWTAICPEPYFTESARTSILYLIDLSWPGANMCY